MIRFMTKAAAFLWLAVANASPPISDGPGSIPGVLMDPAGIAYDASEIINEVGNVFGAEAANQLTTLLTTTNVQFAELQANNKYGDSCKYTIALNTKDAAGNVIMSLPAAAMTVVHEMSHVLTAIQNGTTFDGGGPCDHAQLHVDVPMDAMTQAGGLYPGVDVCFMIQ